MGIFRDRDTAPACEPPAKPRETVVRRGAGAKALTCHSEDPAIFIPYFIVGDTHAEIATKLGRSRATVSMMANRPEVRAAVERELSERRRAATVHVQRATLEAIRYLEAVVSDDLCSTRDRIRAAIEILDRGGLAKSSTSHTIVLRNAENGTVVEIDDITKLTDEQVAEAAKYALETAAK